MAPFVFRIRSVDPIQVTGKVTKIVGLTVECQIPGARMGELATIFTADGRKIPAEVAGFKNGSTILMPLGYTEGVSPGDRVTLQGKMLSVAVSKGMLGRILDGLGRPADGKGPILPEDEYPVMAPPPHPLERPRISEKLPVGVRAIDALLTIGKGQRIGIFAGSGVGKSTLLGMMARYTTADVNVIALIGERGREVREFIERDLREGIRKSVVVVATSDQPALVRLRGAFVATAIAEFFRDKGYDVLFMMDSLTRFAMAQREVGMSVGEPPSSRGYTPSVFSLLPRLLERAGTSPKGTITAIYTVLVEGDDVNEPISDTVRAILDGHIVLSRRLASRAHYPPIDILHSVSRVMPDIVDTEHLKAAMEMKKLWAVYHDSEDLISIGAYVKGANAELDRAVEKIAEIRSFLQQDRNETASFDEAVERLKKIVWG